MRFLETLARKAFYDFCAQLGEYGIWENLSKKRQLAWAKEVRTYLDLVADDLLKPLKKAPQPDNKVNTSYAMGFNQGVNSERVRLITAIDNLKRQVEQEYQELQDASNEDN